jgi:lincosamide nucleotidyltransferase A/C/D/E
VVFDAAGNGLYGPQPADGDGRVYPAASFSGSGRIAGEPVRCMTAEYQVANHATYDPGEADLHDLRALHQAFGVALPDEYTRHR